MTSNARIEEDALGPVTVANDKYWGAQTERARRNFDIGETYFPDELIHALTLIKKKAALVNNALGLLETEKSELIRVACNEVLEGAFQEHFPLKVWISGSGTQLNMNVNEVVANRANELAGQPLGTKSPVHPNDHVNKSQSSNDVIPTAIHLAVARMIHDHLLVSLDNLYREFDRKAKAYEKLVKVGRTHLQDAVPMTFGQELSGYARLLKDNQRRLHFALEELYPLALGGTAVGTQLNAPAGFAEKTIRHIAEETGLPFVSADNKFALMGSHDGLVMTSGMLKTLAVSLYKIANDIRLLASGPRSGLNELFLPANEPGSSIMPGKVNPTQCEALAMAANHVMGLDSAVAFGGAGGHLEMNVFKPLMGVNLIHMIKLLSDAMTLFNEHCLMGLEPNEQMMEDYVSRSLMLVTALNPAIGYDKASEIAHLAHEENLSLKEAALKTGYVDEETFDRLVDPLSMT